MTFVWLMLSLPAAQAAPLNVYEAMRSALEKNYDVRLSVLSVAEKSAGVTKALADFDVTASGTLTREHSETPSSSSLDGVGSVVRSDVMSLKPTLSTKTPYGTELSVPYNYSTSESNSSYNRIPVGHNSSLAVKVTQPLLKPFADGYYRRNVRRAELDLEQAKAKHGEKLDDTAFKAAELFLDVAREQQTGRTLESAHENARQTEEFVKAKHKVGKSSAIEVLEAEVAASKAWESVLANRLSLQVKRDDLMAHVYGSPRAGELTTDFSELLSEKIKADADALIPKARQRRAEIFAQRHALKKAEVEFAAARTDLQPTLNLEASYTHKGLAEGFSTSSEQVVKGQFPSWSMGVKIERPLQQYAGRSAHESKRLAIEQQTLKEAILNRDVELEVRKAIRDIEVNWERLTALRLAAEAQKRRFEALATKFRGGQLSITEYNRARSDAESSEVDEIKSRYALVKARLKLLLVTGELLDHLKTQTR